MPGSSVVISGTCNCTDVAHAEEQYHRGDYYCKLNEDQREHEFKLFSSENKDVKPLQLTGHQPSNQNKSAHDLSSIFTSTGLRMSIISFTLSKPSTILLHYSVFSW